MRLTITQRKNETADMFLMRGFTLAFPHLTASQAAACTAWMGEWAKIKRGIEEREQVIVKSGPQGNPHE